MNANCNNTVDAVLTQRHKALAACAALEARGELVRLESAVTFALDSGVTISELKEVFSHLYAYAGFPRTINALGVLEKIAARPEYADRQGAAFERPAQWDDAAASLRDGTDVQTRLVGFPFTYTFCPQADHYLKAHLFGDIFAGNMLTHAEREIVTVAALSALSGVEPELAAHKAGAVRLGNAPELIDALCIWLDQAGYTLKSEFDKGSLNTAYAPYFAGNSYLNLLRPANLDKDEKSVLPMYNVSFEPGCRNNWHVHHGAHQMLVCLSGSGWYQEYGKAPIALTPGTVIDIPEGVKHWHGARKDCWMQHIATHVVTAKSGEKVWDEWLEPVAEEDYNWLG